VGAGYRQSTQGLGRGQGRRNGPGRATPRQCAHVKVRSALESHPSASNSWHGRPYCVPMTDRQTIVLDARAMDRTLRRMADEIVEVNDGTDDLIIVGIQRRAVQLAARIVSSIRDRENVDVPSGALDITLYRAHLQTVGPG